jgi:hypothetical protein
MFTSRFLVCYFYSCFNSQYLVVIYKDSKFLSLLLSVNTTVTGTYDWTDTHALMDKLDRCNMGKATVSTRAHTSLDQQVTHNLYSGTFEFGICRTNESNLSVVHTVHNAPYHHLLTSSCAVRCVYQLTC